MFSQFSSATSDNNQISENTLDNLNSRVSSPFQEYTDNIAASMRQVDSSFLTEYTESSLSFQPNIDHVEYPSSPALVDFTSQQRVDNFYNQGMDGPDLSQISSFDVNASRSPPVGEKYPNMLSPPDTPAFLPRRHRISSDNISTPYDHHSWNSEHHINEMPYPEHYSEQQMNELPYQQQQHPSQHQQLHHHRAMSLPHISMPHEYQMVQMNFNPAANTSKPYSRKSSLSSNGSDKIYICSNLDCGRAFSRIQNLRSHMRCHLVTTPHNCKTCGLGFRRTTDLQRHIRTMHVPNDQKPWACSKCPKRFGRSDALKRHMSSRSKDHGCPGGPDLELVRQIEEKKRKKLAKRALETVTEGF